MRTCLLFRVSTLLPVLFAAAYSSLTLHAEVRLPKIFGNHMVLQRDKPIVICGWAAPNEMISVELGDSKSQAKANDKGEWKTTLPGLKASASPGALTIKGSTNVRFEDVLIGEVWLASGKSNMEMGIGACQNGKEEIAAADHPNIRLLMIQPLDTTSGGGFRAVGSGRELESLLAKDGCGGRLGRVFRCRILL